MSDIAAVDRINQPAMRQAVLEYAAIAREGLNAAERAALDGVIGRVRGKRILDLGVGAGRTVAGLRAISAQYTGVDYAPEMVAYCQNAYPGVPFHHVDARALPFDAAAFDLVVFACNGISMVDHPGRLAILAQIRRVLAPGGVFIFSTCNRNSPQFGAGFQLPAFQWSCNPARLFARSLRFVRDTSQRLRNRRRLKPQELITSDYALINDTYHNYGVMLYYISLQQQLRQLADAGFHGAHKAYDLAGRAATHASTDSTLTFAVEV